jgi:hypothetical protein
VHRRALQTDSVANVRGPWNQPLATPLALDVHHRRARLSLQSEFDDSLVVVPHGSPLVLGVHGLADTKRIVQIAEAVGSQ